MWGEGAIQKKMEPVCQLNEKRTHHMYNGRHLSSPCPEATQLSLSLYASGTSQATVPKLDLRGSAWE